MPQGKAFMHSGHPEATENTEAYAVNAKEPM